MPSPDTLKRLAFVRYLHGQATEQLRRPEPLCSTAMLTIQDAVELFLGLALVELGITAPNNLQFMGYFDQINSKLAPKSLTRKPEMNRLNKSRVQLKHHGTHPSKEEIRGFLGEATHFFEENCTTVFGHDFGEISLANLVTSRVVQERIKQAEDRLGKGELPEAALALSTAFETLLSEFDTNIRQKIDQPWNRLGLGRHTIVHLNHYVPSEHRQAFEALAEAIDKAFVQVEDRLRVMQLDLGDLRYLRFRSIVPKVWGSTGRRWGDGDVWGGEKEKAYTPDEIRYCLDFVVESALRIQNFAAEAP